MSDRYKHISEKAARKASDELARVKAEQRTEARAKSQEHAKGTADLIDPTALPTVNNGGGVQSIVVH
jgi:hypothetical protein